MQQFISQSASETELLGYQFGKHLQENSILCFFGDLAAGKTTFIRGLSEGLNVNGKIQVNSPTFVYLNIYEGIKTVYHFDLYRLYDEDEFLSMGFDEYFYSGGICCIEWSERISSLLPAGIIKIEINHIAEHIRQITITK